MLASFFAIVLLGSCGNETPIEETQPKQLAFVAGWGEHRVPHGGCYSGGLFCRKKDWWDCLSDASNDVCLNVGLGDDEVAGTGKLIVEQGAEVLYFDFPKNTLNEESRFQLLQAGAIQLEEYEFDPELVRELYKRAGAAYKGEPLIVPAGLYKVQTETSGDGVLMAITIDVTVTIGKVKIRVRISW